MKEEEGNNNKKKEKEQEQQEEAAAATTSAAVILRDVEAANDADAKIRKHLGMTNTTTVQATRTATTTTEEGNNHVDNEEEAGGGGGAGATSNSNSNSNARRDDSDYKSYWGRETSTSIGVGNPIRRGMEAADAVDAKIRRMSTTTTTKQQLKNDTGVNDDNEDEEAQLDIMNIVAMRALEAQEEEEEDEPPTTTVASRSTTARTTSAASSIRQPQPQPPSLTRNRDIAVGNALGPGAYSLTPAGEETADNAYDGSNHPVSTEFRNDEDEVAPRATTTAAANDDDEGLVEALPVDYTEFSISRMEEAQQMTAASNSAAGRKNKQQQQQQRQCILLVAVALAFGLILIIGLGVGLAGRGSGSTAQEKKDPTPTSPTKQEEVVSPHPSTTSFPSTPSAGSSAARDNPLEFLWSSSYWRNHLPESTLDNLNNSSTPQWKALQWLSNHPNITGTKDYEFEEWRKVQLFALVTTYYSLEGDHWPQLVKDRWLSYSKSECYWWSGQFGDFEGDGGTYRERPQSHNTSLTDPCNSRGEFQTLALDTLQLGHPPEEETAASAGRRRRPKLYPRIPPEIALLTSLTQIHLRGCDMEGSLNDFLPSTLYTQMPQLQELGLRGNRLSGTIPPGFVGAGEDGFLRGGQLPSLRMVDFYDNRLSGVIPTELGLVFSDSMVNMNLANNTGIDGVLPSQMGLLTKLTSLYMHHLTNLQRGTIPTQFGRMTQMEDLQLYNNSFTGVIPSQLGLMTNVKNFWLYDNYLEGTIPNSVGHQLTSMESLGLHNNFNLTGTIPTGLGAMTNLTELYLFNSSLTGAIPSQLGRLTALTTMFLFDNALTGTIPTELGGMQNMEFLALLDNHLTGTIPVELATQLPNLTQLTLDRNYLEGTIPPQFGHLVVAGKLIGFFVEHNEDLIGTVPSALCYLGPCYPNPFYPQYCYAGVTFDCGGSGSGSGSLCGCDDRCDCSTALVASTTSDEMLGNSSTTEESSP